MPLGYADGVPRGAAGRALVQARGRRWPIAGTVCMDQIVVDFGDEPVSPGEEVVLFGPGDDGEATAQEWGEALGTISSTRSSPGSARGCPGPTPASRPASRPASLPASLPAPRRRPPMRDRVEVATAEEMRALGRRLAAALRAGDLLVLGWLRGAGKTTLVQGIGDGLGVRGPITSPTFVIARVHPSLRGGPALVHAGRVPPRRCRRDPDDLDLDSGTASSVTAVEWGEGLAEGLSDDRLEISIELSGAALVCADAAGWAPAGPALSSHPPDPTS